MYVLLPLLSRRHGRYSPSLSLGVGTLVLAVHQDPSRDPSQMSSHWWWRGCGQTRDETIQGEAGDETGHGGG
jgi:hypothetical protein